MFKKFIDFIKNLFKPEWEQPGFDFNDYPFFTETVPMYIKNYTFLSHEDKVALLKIGLKAKRTKQTFKINLDYIKENPLSFKMEGRGFNQKPKIISCELCSDISRSAFVYESNVERLFTKKQVGK